MEGIEIRKRCFSVRDSFGDVERQFLAFNMPFPKSTLASLFSNYTMWPLPQRHVREICLQIAAAVDSMSQNMLYYGSINTDMPRGLHNLGRVVGDISPDHIEFVDPSIVLEPYYDCFEASFRMKVSGIVSVNF